jgi:uncharacterized lipoprotein NlpE involved in copper resistance
MSHRFFIRFTLVGMAMLSVMGLVGCSNQAAFTAVDYANCQKLGFNPGTQYYEMCLSEVQQQRTAEVTKSEPLTDQSSDSYPNAN